jgi:hypothetical protein
MGARPSITAVGAQVLVHYFYQYTGRAVFSVMTRN